MTLRVNEYILWLDVSVTDAQCMNVGNRPHQLVGVKFHNQGRYHLLHFDIILHDFVNCLRDVVHYYI